ncbi:MAG: hypothetical protein KGZ74_06540 [Chitinophagaceae bacterium]|nr:hypothetical protein [Chitinophagaceae bacterium]
MTQIKYTLTSPKFTGKLVFGYTNGLLTHFECAAQMKEEGYKWILENFPLVPSTLKKMADAIPGKMEVVPEDLSFDAFWNAYGKKANRHRCEPLWNKLSDADRIECLSSIKPYDSYLKRVNYRAKLDPENYLKKEAFRNNWNQLTS